MWNLRTLYILSLLVITLCPLLLVPQLWHVPARKPLPSLKGTLVPGFPILVAGITISTLVQSKTLGIVSPFALLLFHPQPASTQPPDHKSAHVNMPLKSPPAPQNFPPSGPPSALSWIHALIYCHILSWVLSKKFSYRWHWSDLTFELTKFCHWLPVRH